mmetsp:Transcript_23173/g.48684  ORF Transcript_23173/g.48684 Transcript_23173/m.48684 type:complete len:853 (+) Transcript_23173:1-2559(+)
MIIVRASDASLGQVTETWRITGGYHEGIAFDRTNNRLLLSSIVSNSIISLDPDNDFELITTYNPQGSQIIHSLGMKVDEGTGQVHLATSDFATFDKGGYALYDMPPTAEAQAAASVSLSLDMPCTNGESGCGLANDVFATENGVAYVTDSMNGRIFKVENGAMEEVVISDPTLLDWVDSAFPFGINGLVVYEEGKLIASNSGAGTIVHVDLVTGEATNVEIIEGDVGGADGLLFSKGRLYLITGTAIDVLESDNGWKKATVAGSINIDQSASGETATTATWGGTDEEIYVSFVRFGDLFGEVGANADQSLIAKVTLTGEIPSIPTLPTITPDTASLGQLTETYRVPAKYPEGIAYDRANNRLLLGSLTSNSIVSLNPANDFALLNTFTPDTDNPSSLGMKVDESTGSVHVATSTFGTFDDGGYARYDLDGNADTASVSTVLSMTCTNGTSGCGLANGVVIGDDAVAYISDSMNGRIFKVEDGAIEEVTSDPLLSWVDQSFPFGSNGMAYDKSNGLLLIANTGAASLVRLQLSTNEVTSIPIMGDIGNVDDVLLDSNNRLFLISGTTIYVLTDEGNEWRSAVVRGTIDVDRSELGESAASGTFGIDESEIYISYVRFNDLFGAGVNDNFALIGKVEVGKVLCLTADACNERRQEIGLKNFYVSNTYPSKGCFEKNGNAFFGEGGSEEDMSLSPLPGLQKRLWCEVVVPTVPPAQAIAEPTPCLTEEECFSKIQELGFPILNTGVYPSKGCFYKENNAYFSDGTMEEMSKASLPGKQKRIWCDNGPLVTKSNFLEIEIPESISYPNTPSSLVKGVGQEGLQHIANDSFLLGRSTSYKIIISLTVAAFTILVVTI